MPHTFAIILFLNSFKILLLFPTPLLLYLTLFSTSKVKNVLLYCSISEHSTSSCRLESCSNLKEEFSIEKTHSAAAKQQWQINYTIRAPICARASIATVSHFHLVEQTGSLYTPHPLLPHGNACYYSRIILDSLPLLLFSELFRHNYLRPTSNCIFPAV